MDIIDKVKSDMKRSSKRVPHLIGMRSDGTISVMIGDKKYVWWTDSGGFGWMRAEFIMGSGWKVVNWLKKNAKPLPTIQPIPPRVEPRQLSLGFRVY